MTKERIWQEVKDLLLKEEVITQVVYNTYLNNVDVKDFEDNCLTLVFYDQFYHSFVQTKYRELMIVALSEVLNIEEDDADVILLYEDESKRKEKNDYSSYHYISDTPNKNGLVDEYVFENFIVGESNQLAYAAAVAVAERPGEDYNPLYIYGKSGLGKTHLLHAIAHHILKQLPGKKILYVSCEKFTNELINSIKKKNTDAFREKYRQIDILLIDDIQFIAGKESTQVEFFHTFDELWLLKKQIILTSDKLPREIENLDLRLSTRFSCGLTADVKMPDLETRIAILEKLAERDHVSVPEDVFVYIAKNIDTSIRDLEGALKRVMVFSQFSNDKKITLEITKNALSDIISTTSKPDITAETIQKVVSEFFNIKSDDLISKTRKAEIAQPRHIAMYMCRKVLNLSYKEIGSCFGGRDHSTVMHACERIENEYENNKNTQNQIVEIEAILSNV